MLWYAWLTTPGCDSQIMPTINSIFYGMDGLISSESHKVQGLMGPGMVNIGSGTDALLYRGWISVKFTLLTSALTTSASPTSGSPGRFLLLYFRPRIVIISAQANVVLPRITPLFAFISHVHIPDAI